MPAGVPIPASHLAPITAFQGLADGSGTCAGPGRSLQAAQPPAPLPGSSPGRSWKRESGKKERKRKREGESGRQRRNKSSAGEQWGEQWRRWSKAAPAGSLTANLLAPASWARGARTMCGARSRPPPSASGWLGTARAPQVSEWRGGPVSRECSPSAPGCRRARSRDSQPAPGAWIYLRPRPSLWAGLQRALEETLDAGRFQKFMLKWGICLIYILEPVL